MKYNWELHEIYAMQQHRSLLPQELIKKIYV